MLECKLRSPHAMPMQAQRRGGGEATRHHKVFSATVRPIFVQDKSDIHYIGGWVGSGAGLDGKKSRGPTVFDPRTVHPVASRYADRAMPAAECRELYEFKNWVPGKRNCFEL
jgi:hypothetical protein